MEELMSLLAYQSRHPCKSGRGDRDRTCKSPGPKPGGIPLSYTPKSVPDPRTLELLKLRLHRVSCGTSTGSDCTYYTIDLRFILAISKETSDAEKC
jgi:hypothetical protein